MNNKYQSPTYLRIVCVTCFSVILSFLIEFYPTFIYCILFLHIRAPPFLFLSLYFTYCLLPLPPPAFFLPFIILLPPFLYPFFPPSSECLSRLKCFCGASHHEMPFKRYSAWPDISVMWAFNAKPLPIKYGKLCGATKNVPRVRAGLKREHQRRTVHRFEALFLEGIFFSILIFVIKTPSKMGAGGVMICGVWCMGGGRLTRMNAGLKDSSQGRR